MSVAKKAVDAKTTVKTAVSGPNALIENINAIAKDAVKVGTEGATVAISTAKKTGIWIGAKTEEAIDRSYETHKPIAEANIARIRKAMPSAPPIQVREVLEEEYLAFLADNKKDVSTNLSATKLFVLSVLEVHGRHVKSEKRVRTLLAEVLLTTSGFARLLVKNGATIAEIVIAIVNSKTGGAAKGVTAATKAVKPTKVKALAKVVAPIVADAAVKHSASQSFIGQAVIAHTKRMLGPIPRSWPAAPKAKPKA